MLSILNSLLWHYTDTAAHEAKRALSYCCNTEEGRSLQMTEITTRFNLDCCQNSHVPNSLQPTVGSLLWWTKSTYRGKKQLHTILPTMKLQQKLLPWLQGQTFQKTVLENILSNMSDIHINQLFCSPKLKGSTSEWQQSQTNGWGTCHSGRLLLGPGTEHCHCTWMHPPGGTTKYFIHKNHISETKWNITEWRFVISWQHSKSMDLWDRLQTGGDEQQWAGTNWPRTTRFIPSIHSFIHSFTSGATLSKCSVQTLIWTVVKSNNIHILVKRTDVWMRIKGHRKSQEEKKGDRTQRCLSAA